MRSIIKFFIFTFCVSNVFFNVYAQNTNLMKTYGVEFAGFFDFQQQFQISPNSNNGMNYGQFELGISKNLNNFVSTEGAIAFNSETEKFELGSAICDIHLFGNDTEHLRKSSFFNSSGIQVGQFDIPFGIDYKFIPSPDRKFVSTPFVVQKTINCMNNLGVNFYGESNFTNFNFFLINGLTDKDVALGGRASIFPFENFELGTSYLANLKKVEINNSRIYGMDFQLTFKQIEFRSEVLQSYGIIEGAIDDCGLFNNHKGYYIQSIGYLDQYFEIPLFVGFRLGYWKTDNNLFQNNIENSLHRITSTLGYLITSGVEVRVELVNDKYYNQNNNTTLTSQLVVNF